MIDQRKLTIFGDSIAVGQGISLNKTWVLKIAEHFNKTFVTNASQNGRTTRQALENMPYEIQSHAPNLLIVQFGLNDCNFWFTDNGMPRVSKNAFFFNLVEIYDRAINFGTEHVFFLTNHPTNRGMLKNMVNYDESVNSYTESILSISNERKNAQIIDTWSALDAYNRSGNILNFNTLLPDGIHLSCVGHEIYFNTIVSVLDKYLND